jgi:putative aminopeptidase FrvX
MIQPDFAIVLDCSPARDSSGDSKEQGQLGGGLLLRYIDASMIARPTLLAYQEAMAKKAKVPFQYYSSPGGTDAGAVHKNLSGIMTLTHCIVARSIHSPSTILDTRDFLSSKKTLLKILKFEFPEMPLLLESIPSLSDTIFTQEWFFHSVLSLVVPCPSVQLSPYACKFIN